MDRSLISAPLFFSSHQLSDIAFEQLMQWKDKGTIGQKDKAQIIQITKKIAKLAQAMVQAGVDILTSSKKEGGKNYELYMAWICTLLCYTTNDILQREPKEEKERKGKVAQHSVVIVAQRKHFLLSFLNSHIQPRTHPTCTRQALSPQTVCS